MNGSPAEYMTLGILQAAAFPSSCGLTALRHIAADGRFGAVEATLADSDVSRARVVLSDAGLLVDFDAGRVQFYDIGAGGIRVSSSCSL